MIPLHERAGKTAGSFALLTHSTPAAPQPVVFVATRFHWAGPKRVGLAAANSIKNVGREEAAKRVASGEQCRWFCLEY